MFPFADDQFAPQNQWYVAAWADEISRTPIERWILDEPIALYRTRDGSAVAVDGRCPHHFYPLGKSPTEGDNIRCGYHGLQFAPDGSCVVSPFVEKVPRACRIKSYAVAERWQWIWIWPGDPALADESMIPDHLAAGLTDTTYATFQGFRMDVAARYQLMNDNLLDLQHLEVLHGSAIGGDGLGRAEETTESGANWVSSTRVLRNFTLPPGMAGLIGVDHADRTIYMQFHIPGIHIGYDAFDGAAGTSRAGEHFGRVNVYHAITPARRHTCHYFTAMGRDFMQHDAAFGEHLRGGLLEVLEQDRFAAEQVERLLSADDRKNREMLFSSDETLVTGRRLVQRMIAAEATPRLAVAGPAEGRA